MLQLLLDFCFLDFEMNNIEFLKSIIWSFFTKTRVVTVILVPSKNPGKNAETPSGRMKKIHIIQTVRHPENKHL